MDCGGLTAASRDNRLVEQSSQRFVFIDALRGIAAVAVLYHHMLHNSVMEATVRRILPVPLQRLSDYGAAGVQIFFVLSGFVIAYSLRNSNGSFAAVKNFILRRQVRLDPVLWVVMLLTLGLDRIRLAIPSLHPQAVPTVVDVIKNIFYLQNVLQARQVVGVSWTLCIEVQFYLVFILLFSVGKLRMFSNTPAIISALSITLLFVSGIGALAYSIFVTDTSPYFIAYWQYFAAGALCCWSLQKGLPHWVFLSFVAAFVALCAVHPTLREFVGCATAFLIYLVGRTGHLTDWLNTKPLQYLGRISYSLYLIHFLVAVSVLQLGYKLTHTNQPMSLFWFVLSGLLSLGVAHLLYAFVERPSLRLSGYLKLRPVPSVFVPPPAVQGVCHRVSPSPTQVGT